MAERRQRIGIMGGTFDPIHIGHLVTAETVRIQYGLDQVLFVPAGNPPHKQGLPVTPAVHRYIMTVMATFSNPFFIVSDMEVARQGPSFTIDTIRALKSSYSAGTHFFFIVGADALLELPTWHDADELLDLCYFVAATRPGCMDRIDQAIERFGRKGRRKIRRLDTPELEISATNIRERIRLGQSIKYIVPESVECYIRKARLYQNGQAAEGPNIAMH